MNKASQIVASVYNGTMAPPKDFARIYRTHKRKLRTQIDDPKPTALMIYEHNWHYASQYGRICPGHYGTIN